MKKVINFSDLNKIINRYQEIDELPQKNAVLILKSDCSPLRGGVIRIETAEEIINERVNSCEKLANILQNLGGEENDSLAFAQLQKAESLNNVIHLVFEDDEEHSSTEI